MERPPKIKISLKMITIQELFRS